MLSGHIRKITSKNQVVIPKVIRDFLCILIGFRFQWLEVLINDDDSYTFKLRLVKERKKPKNTTTVTDKFEFAIPKYVREGFFINSGDRIEWFNYWKDEEDLFSFRVKVIKK